MRKILPTLQIDYSKQVSAVLLKSLEPSKASSDSKNPRYRVTIDKSDEPRMLQMAKAAGFSRPTLFLKHLIEAALRQKRIASFSPSMEEKIRQLTIAIRSNGVLLNQIAKQANTIQRVSFPQLIQAGKKLNDLEQLLLDFSKNPW